jgi:hypothetical protein
MKLQKNGYLEIVLQIRDIVLSEQLDILLFLPIMPLNKYNFISKIIFILVSGYSF